MMYIKKIIILCFILVLNIYAVEKIDLNKSICFINNKVITLSDINKIILDYYENGIIKSFNPDKKIINKILFNMVEQQIVLNAARKYHIEVTNDDLERIIINKITELKSSFANQTEFDNFLKSKKLTLEKYKNLLTQQLKNNDSIQKNIIHDKFINQSIFQNIVVTQKELYNEYNYSLILVKKMDLIKKIYLKLKRGESFYKLAKKYHIGPKKKDGGVQGFKHIGEILFSIEQKLIDMNEGDISGFFPVTTDDSNDLLGFAIIKLIKIKKIDKNDILKKIIKDKLNKDIKYKKLSDIEKKIIDEKFQDYKNSLNKRVFAMKMTNLKKDLLKKLWENSFVKLNY